MKAISEDLDQVGYTIVREAIDPEYAAAIGREVTSEHSRLCDAGWRFQAGGRIMGHLAFTPSVHGPRIVSILRERGFFTAVEEYVGQVLNVVAYVGNFNLPASRNQEWHQDWSPLEDRIVFNVLLSDTTVRNAPTEIIPGSQADRFNYRQLHTSGVLKRAVQFTGRSGDLLIRRGTVWHRGTSNNSAQPRPMFGVIAEPGAVRSDDLPCPGPISFSANRFYGRNAHLREIAASYGAPLLHLKRLVSGIGSPKSR